MVSTSASWRRSLTLQATDSGLTVFEAAYMGKLKDDGLTAAKGRPGVSLASDIRHGARRHGCDAAGGEAHCDGRRAYAGRPFGP